jgi:GDP-L-fucose synthase
MNKFFYVLLFFLLLPATLTSADSLYPSKKHEPNLSPNSRMKHTSKIYIAGHAGLVGSALCEKLTEEGYTNLITRRHQELDLRDQNAVNLFFTQEKPEYVFLAAARVGGIHANTSYPAEFLYDNLMITSNIIHAAYCSGVKKLLFLGSSCIYPRDCPQPIKEEYLLTGALEKTNEWYALAKITGLKLCQSYNRQYGTHFISCMPTNLYGANDHYDVNNSHVIPALITKFCQAQKEEKSQVICWGTGTARREFLHVKDLADALVYLMLYYENYDENSWINIGTGTDITIGELINLVKELVGFKGEVIFDTTKPDGTPRKMLNIDNITKLGWQPKISLRDGLKEVIAAYKKNHL